MTPMPSPPEIIVRLRARGVKLWVEYAEDRTASPKLDQPSKLAPEDWQALKADRAAAIAYLVAEQHFAEDAAMDFFQKLQRCGLKLVESRPGYLSVDPPEAENRLDRETIAGLGQPLLDLVRDVAKPLPFGLLEQIRQQDQRRTPAGGALRLVASGGSK